MPVALTEVLAQADAPKPAPKSRQRHSTVVIGTPSYLLTGDELMREIRGAMRSVPAARRLDESEADALAQAVAVSVLSGVKRPKGSPAEVLRWIDRVERFPTWARMAGDSIPRGSVGRTFLAARVRSVMAQRADWQDTSERYRTRAQSQRDTGPMISPVGGSADVDAVGRLAASLDPTAVDVSPADVLDLARAVARELAADPVACRRITARLVQAMAGDGAPEAMAALAQEEGRTLNAVRVDAARAVLPELEPADLLALVRDVARAERLTREPDPTRPDLTGRELAAGNAVAALARAGGAWDPASIRSGRSLPDWPDARPAADAAPLPAASRPGVGAVPTRKPYSPNGQPMAHVPARKRRTRWTPADQDALFARAW